MSKSDITDTMNDWEYALYNMRRKRKERVNTLMEKYGFPMNKRNILPEDYYEYDLLKSDIEAIEATSDQTSKLMQYSLSLDDEDMTQNVESVKAQEGTISPIDTNADFLRKIRKNDVKYKELKPNFKQQNTWIDKAAEIIATSDVARKAALAMQGAADSYINLPGLTLRFKNYIQNGEFSTGIDHIEPKDKFEKMIELAGEMLYEAGPALRVGKTAAKNAVIQYDKHQFGKAYKKVYNELLEKHPGDAEEIMATAHKLFGKDTHIQRGAAAFTADEKLITQGRKLKKATEGKIERNYGLTKEIGLHNMSEADVKALPDILQKYEPVEVNDRGQYIYEILGENGKTRRIVTALREINGKLRRVIISDYWINDIKTPVRELLK